MRPLARYPRPINDTGLCFHLAPDGMTVAQATQWAEALATRYPFITWVKMLPSEPGSYKPFVERGIFPVLRPYLFRPAVQDLTPGQRAAIAQFLSEGGIYVESDDNEWNLVDEVQDGLWGKVDLAYEVAHDWLDLAEYVQGLGGIPGTPACAPGGNWNDMEAMDTFFARLKEQWESRVRAIFERGAFLAVHNYTISHDMMYPDSDPARPETWSIVDHWTPALFGSPRLMQDSNSFRKYEAYEMLLQKHFGIQLPALSTEGGTHIGSRDDTRYPEVDAGRVHMQVLDEARFMRDKAPQCLFVASAHWLAVARAWPAAHHMFDNDDPYSPNMVWRPVLDDLRGMGNWIRHWDAEPGKGSGMYPTSNFDAGRNGVRPAAVVLHTMVGTLSGCDSHFADPASKVSAHYGIGLDGTIHQYVQEEDTAWANGLAWKNGRWLTPGGVAVSPSALVVRNRPGINPNLYTISIEHEGDPETPVSKAMWDASVKLTRDICERWHITKDRLHIIGHNEINPIDKRDCPGSRFDMGKYVAAVNNLSWLGDFQHAANTLAGTFLDPGAPAGGADAKQVWIQYQPGKRRDFIYLDGKTYAEVYPPRS